MFSYSVTHCYSRLESTETFMVSLALPSVDQIGLQIGEPEMAIVTITDDDSKSQDPKHTFWFIPRSILS